MWIAFRYARLTIYLCRFYVAQCYFVVDKKKRSLDKLGNVLQFYVEIVIFIKNVIAEGKTSACQNTSFISATFYKLFTKKVYISNVIILKNEKIFRNRNFYPKSSLLSSFSATENEHLCYLDLARQLWAKNIVLNV
jgi:hypothetical protein